MYERMRTQPAETIEPMEPSLAQATSSEMFRCSKCGCEFETEGKNEGPCPCCTNTCTRDSCRVMNASNEGF